MKTPAFPIGVSLGLALQGSPHHSIKRLVLVRARNFGRMAAMNCGVFEGVNRFVRGRNVFNLAPKSFGLAISD